MKLNKGQINIICLIGKERNPDGWAPISEQLYSSLSKILPPKLVIMEETDTGGRAKLTEEGNCVLVATKWL